MRLLLRWSWRDLRTHWPKVLAIAVVIAIGTGGYAGLTSTTEWRQTSYDISYRQLAMYDVRVDLAPGSTVDEGSLREIVPALPHAGWIADLEERLIIPTQVDASTASEAILVRGEITGSDFSSGGPHVNGYHAFTGRLLTASDAGAPAVMVERSFATFYQLADTGRLAISGDRQLEYVGQASTPEYFAVAPEGEMFMSEATFAGLFTTLETAQQLAGLPGRVNNMVLTIADDADRATVVRELEDALTEIPAGTTVSTRDANLSYDALTSDIEQDQAMFDALAVLLIAGAVGAAFNLIHRLTEQQRREIGIGMALGVRPRVLAIRPLLVSAQIALLGVVFGVAVGTLIGNAMGTVLTQYVPLPVWDTSFQSQLFARVAVVGFVAPFAATALPVWRAVRVAPIRAIKPTYLTGRPPAARRPVGRRRNTFRVMPFRNLRRAPRRTVLTIAAIAASLTVLVGFLGIMDSVFAAVDTAEQESTGTTAERIAVALDTFHLVRSPEVESVRDAASVAVAEPTLRVTGSVRTPAATIDVFVELVDFQDGMWRPSLVAGTFDSEPGILLPEKAAADLGVAVGDRVTLRHPVREGLSYRFVETDLPVTALHPHPVRGFAYMDLARAGLFNLSGITNALNVRPVPGAGLAEVQRELFGLDWVSSAQAVTTVTEAVRNAFDQILAVVQVMVTAILLLALLIAFNTAAINLDARAREHATMFAFGVSVRTALRMAVTESLMIGIAATALGFAGGAAMVWWMTQRLLADTLPDFGIPAAISPTTIAILVGMGLLAVATAPLLTTRRMRRMDVPGALRLVE